MRARRGAPRASRARACVSQSYRDSRHYIVYEDGQEDVGIIDGRNLWLFEDDKWTSMRLRWKDEDVNRGLSYSSAYNRVEPEAQRDTGDGKKPAASEAKDDAQSAPGVPVTADNPAGGFMIGCDMCGTGRCRAPDRRAPDRRARTRAC